MINIDEKYMKEALKEAKKAYLEGEVPVGCVVVCDNKIIARSHNTKESKKNALFHAELIAINKASKKIGDWRLDNCDLYVTLEPCQMCAGALMQARIRKVIYGCSDNKNGSIDTLMKMYEVKGFNHYPEVVSGVLTEECSTILKNFFKELRKTPLKD